jgi:hypothetical protein
MYKRTIHGKFVAGMNPIPFMQDYEDIMERVFTEYYE